MLTKWHCIRCWLETTWDKTDSSRSSHLHSNTLSTQVKTTPAKLEEEGSLKVKWKLNNHLCCFLKFHSHLCHFPIHQAAVFITVRDAHHCAKTVRVNITSNKPTTWKRQIQELLQLSLTFSNVAENRTKGAEHDNCQSDLTFYLAAALAKNRFFFQ